MKIRILAAAAMASLFVSACSDSRPPAIELDQKISCQIVAQSRALGDVGTFSQVFSMVIATANRRYTGDSDVEVYYRNVLRPNPMPLLAVRESVMNQCVADTGRPLADAFRDAVEESYLRNRYTTQFGSCKAFNDGNIAFDKVWDGVMRSAAVREGAFSNAIERDATGPDRSGFEASVKQGCAADGTQLLSAVVMRVTGEAATEARGNREAELATLQADYVAQTRGLIKQADADQAAGKPVSCEVLKRIDTDSNVGMEEERQALFNRLAEAELRGYSAAQAAFVRRSMGNGHFSFGTCADDGDDFRKYMADYLPEDAATLANWVGYNRSEVEAEERRRQPVQQDVSSDEVEEDLEMQMNRASRFEAEEALYKQRQAEGG